MHKRVANTHNVKHSLYKRQPYRIARCITKSKKKLRLTEPKLELDLYEGRAQPRYICIYITVSTESTATVLKNQTQQMRQEVFGSRAFFDHTIIKHVKLCN